MGFQDSATFTCSRQPQLQVLCVQVPLIAVADNSNILRTVCVPSLGGKFLGPSTYLIDTHICQ